MQIISTFSFKGGEEFLNRSHPTELSEIIEAIQDLDATTCLTKESKEKTMRGDLLFSPPDMNKRLRLYLRNKGWSEYRHSFGSGRFREMDGVKNMVGLEIQFGKYAFMGYDIFSKMVIFKKHGHIECGVEVVPTEGLVNKMSTGVSSFDQLLVDFENRGESNIDIPVFVLGIGLTTQEDKRSEEIRKHFKEDGRSAIAAIKLRKYHGSKPGPK